MSQKGDAVKAVTRNLHAAIERVREDVSKVEFWADAVTGFTQPVPDYNSGDAKIWLPGEQAKSLTTTGNNQNDTSHNKLNAGAKQSDDSTRS